MTMRTDTDPAATPARHAACPAPGPRNPDTIAAEPSTAKHNRSRGAMWLTFRPSGLTPGFAVFVTDAERAQLAAWLADTTRTDTLVVGK